MKKSETATLADIKLIHLESRFNLDSHLVAYEEIFKRGAVRCFSIVTKNNLERGNHAHIISHQWFVAMAGSVTVECFDGKNRSEYTLQQTTDVLSVPPGIWSRQIYSQVSNLLVFTDTQYDESDYIRDLNDFEAWKFG